MTPTDEDLRILERVCHDAQRWKAFTNTARHSKSDRARLVKIVEKFHRMQETSRN